MSPPEALLWQLLRGSPAGIRFRRQYAIGPYVADFLCFSHRLIIELDGPFHDPDHDRKRDAWLRSKGFEVLRFPVSLIHGRPHLALQAIREAASARPPSLGPFETNFLPEVHAP